MRQTSLDTRRQILKLKFDGLSNREVADRCDVSKGTVANVLEEARTGEFPGFAELEDEVDALFELRDRLDDAEASITDAQLGLDVLAWLDNLGIDPSQLKTFHDRLDELASGEMPIDEYGSAAIRLRSVERATDYAFDGQIEGLLDVLDEYGPETIDQLVRTATTATELGKGPAEVEQAVEQALTLQDQGFTPGLATALATELASVDSTSEDETINRLGDLYERFDSLDIAVQELSNDRDSLEAEIDELRDEKEELEADRDRLHDRLDVMETSISVKRDALAENVEHREELQQQIDELRSEREELEANRDTLKRELADLEDERAVVHAYRRFLRDEVVSTDLVDDVADLVDIRRGRAEHLAPFEPTIQERVRDELMRLAREMIEGEEMIPVAEHERKLEEARKHERESYQQALEEQRDQYLEVIETSTGLFESVTSRLENLQSLLDDEFATSVVEEFEAQAEEEVDEPEELIRLFISAGLDAEVDSRVEQVCNGRINDRIQGELDFATPKLD